MSDINLERSESAEKLPASPEAYDTIVDAANLADIKLVKSDFELQPQALSSDQEGWKYGYGCVVKHHTLDIDGGLLTGFVECEAFCRSGRKRLTSLKARYIVVYLLEGSPDELAAEQFICRVGAFAVYPYFRAHFAELTSQAGLNISPLPIMKEGKRRLPAAPIAAPVESVD